MEILMTGEIYLKKGPTLIKPEESFAETEEFDLMIQELKEDPNVPKDYIEYLISNHQKEEERKEKGILDYTGCNSFWMSVIKDDGIYMVEKSNSPVLDVVRKYNSKEEVDRDFIRLRVFLEKAKYVGKKFKRTKVLEVTHSDGGLSLHSDYLFIPSTILYAMGDCSIVLSEYGFLDEKKFSVMSSQYIKDGNYEIMDGVNDEYKDQAALYQKVLHQLTDGQKKIL